MNSEDTCDNNLACSTQKGNMSSEEKVNSTQIIQGGEGLEIQDGDGDGETTNKQLEKADSKTCRDAKERVGPEGLSFSDIEDDGTDLSGRFSVTNPPRTSSSTEASDWVQLRENLDSKLDQQRPWKQDRDSEAGDSSDWFNVDEFD